MDRVIEFIIISCGRVDDEEKVAGYIVSGEVHEGILEEDDDVRAAIVVLCVDVLSVEVLCVVVLCVVVLCGCRLKKIEFSRVSGQIDFNADNQLYICHYSLINKFQLALFDPSFSHKAHKYTHRPTSVQSQFSL